LAAKLRLREEGERQELRDEQILTGCTLDV
jgi:hypothetical protein